MHVRMPAELIVACVVSFVFECLVSSWQNGDFESKEWQIKNRTNTVEKREAPDHTLSAISMQSNRTDHINGSGKAALPRGGGKGQSCGSGTGDSTGNSSDAAELRSHSKDLAMGPTHPAASVAGSKILFTSLDSKYLSPQLCLARRQIEVFVAACDDVASRRGFGRRPRPGTLKEGQVGLRCIHCKHLPPGERTASAVFYPGSIRLVYQSVRNFQRHHFLSCPCMPDDQKQKFIATKSKYVQSKPKSRTYWAKCCVSMGMVDVKGGIRLRNDPEILSGKIVPLSVVSSDSSISSSSPSWATQSESSQTGSSAHTFSSLTLANSATRSSAKLCSGAGAQACINPFLPSAPSVPFFGLPSGNLVNGMPQNQSQPLQQPQLDSSQLYAILIQAQLQQQQLQMELQLQRQLQQQQQQQQSHQVVAQIHPSTCSGPASCSTPIVAPSSEGTSPHTDFVGYLRTLERVSSTISAAKKWKDLANAMPGNAAVDERLTAADGEVSHAVQQAQSDAQSLVIRTREVEQKLHNYLHEMENIASFSQEAGASATAASGSTPAEMRLRSDLKEMTEITSRSQKMIADAVIARSALNSAAVGTPLSVASKAPVRALSYCACDNESENSTSSISSKGSSGVGGEGRGAVSEGMITMHKNSRRPTFWSFSSVTDQETSSSGSTCESPKEPSSSTDQEGYFSPSKEGSLSEAAGA